MFEFHASGGGVLRLTADFSAAGFANISFFDAAQRDILAHLSLRADRSLAVFNRRLSDAWEAERPMPVALDGGPLRVEFRFSASGLVIRVGDRVVFDLPDGSLERLYQIAWHELHGGFQAAGMELDGAENRARRALGGLVHVAPFGIEGWALDQALVEQVLRVQVQGMADAPAPFLFDRPELTVQGGTGVAPRGLVMRLPGRIWAQQPGTPVVLKLTANGCPAGADLRLDPADMARQIDLALRQPGMGDDAETAMLCLEHVQQGGFWPALSAPARASLRKIAQTYGLEELLAEQDAPGAALAPKPDLDEDEEDSSTRDARRADAFFLDLVERHRATPGGLDLARAVADLPAIRPDARRALFALLTELYCAEDRFDALHARAEAEGLADQPDSASGWQKSVRLPWLVQSGRVDQFTATLWQLVEDADAWISTAPILWSVRRLLAGDVPGLRAEAREEAIYPVLELIERRSASYWGRATSRDLLQVMVAFLQAAPGLPDWAQMRIQQVALRAHGLSRQFWDLVAAAEAGAGLVLRPELRAARRAFHTIRDHLQGQPQDPASLEAALGLFDGVWSADAARMRRECLGPLGLAGPIGSVQAVERLTARPEGLGSAALRILAYPSEPPLLSDIVARDLAPAVRQAVRQAHDANTRAPLHDLQSQVSRALLAWTLGPDDAPVAPLLPDLAALGQVRESWLGLVLAVGLMETALTLGRTVAVRDLTLWLADRLERMQAPDRTALGESLPFGQALRRLELCAEAVQEEGGDLPRGLAGLIRRLPRPATGAVPLPADPDPGITPPALFDLVVVIVSCRPYLDSRIPAMRRAWVDRLDELGIPWVVAVGGHDGPARRDGHILHLPAPDDYEGLPQKVLAAFDWVRSRTRAGHVLKIDDDCFLDVDGFLHAQSWRKFPYYGRKLYRAPGQMDRAWHQAKSTTPRGRLELDKSPEPSTYCDGGSGYVLARTAMEALAKAQGTLDGQWLIQSSFMEDKMVGDLLSRAGIWPADEDHLVAVLRRGRPGGMPVSVWSNSFLPSVLSGVKVAHLDRIEAQEQAADILHLPELWPKKIWPSYSATNLISNSNLLELVSPVARLQDLARAPLSVVAVMRNEMFMLPHFLAHYRKLGVRSFLIADNLSDDGTLDYLLAQPDVVTFSVDSDYRVSHYGVAWQQAILSNFRVGKWSLMVDADEFLVADELTLAQLTQADDAAEAHRIFMLDMYPGGSLSAADFQTDPFAEAGFCDRVPFLAQSAGQGPFGDQPTWTSALRHRLIPRSRPELFVAQKVALLKYQPWMRLSAGLHYVGDVRLSGRDLIFAHFKYHAEFAAKAKLEVARRQHFNDAEEYRKYLAILSEGRDVIFDPALSVRWRDSPVVQRILTQGHI